MKIVTTNAAKNMFLKAEDRNDPWSDAGEWAMVNIYDDIAYQSVLGFGGAFTEAAAYNYSLMSDTQKKDFLKAYFDTEEGIGYNFGRTHINSCDFSLDIYSYVESGDETLDTFDIARDKKYIIPFIKDAMKYCKSELVLFASPWSPPGYMKDNGKAINGGKLLDKYKDLWALYYAKYVKEYAKCGIKISAITVQNEPNAVQTWESCNYTAEDERDFIKDHLIPVLDREGLADLKIIIWDHNKERLYDRAKEVLEDPTVNDRVWAVGHHWYSGDHFDALRLVSEQFHKPLICTEFCGGIDEPALEVAEKYGREICENFNNYETAICDWNILLSENGGPFHNRTGDSEAAPGVVHDPINGGCYAPVLFSAERKELVFTPIYYYIGHFSKFVARGAKRLAVTKYTSDLYVCAFKNPDDSIVLIIMNTADRDLPANIRLHGKCFQANAEAHSIMTVII